jgi:glycosyltransferase involved in cell wall biosynthesis
MGIYEPMETGTERMKILLFVARLGIGGAERQITQLALGLAHLGHEISLWTLYPGGQLADELASSQVVSVGHLCVLPPSSAIQSAAAVVAAPARLRSVVRGEDPDVVYSFLYPSGAIAGAAVPREGRCRWVLGIRSAQARLNWKRAAFFKLCAYLSRRASLLVANSEQGLSDHVERGFRAASSKVVFNGIDTDRFRPAVPLGAAVRRELGISDAATVIGRVGRLTAVKDHPSFLRAVSELKGQIPDLVALCVGDGAARYSSSLRDQSKALGLDDTVIWTGNRDDMTAVYNAMDLAVSNSSSEGFPNVVAEAMACGVPCVVTDAGASAQVVGDTGRVVPAGDVGALVEGIRAALDDPVDPTECRARIEGEFSLEKMVSATEEALHSVCEPSV